MFPMKPLSSYLPITPSQCKKANQSESKRIKANTSSLYELARFRALDLFAKKGYGQVGMRELAVSMGIAPGSFYNHFSSKQELLFDLIEEFAEALCTIVVPSQQKQIHFQPALTATLSAHFSLYREKRTHLQLFERDFYCLSADNQDRINQLQLLYKDGLIKILLPLSDASRNAATSIADLSIAIFKSIPHLQANGALPDEMLEKLILSSVNHVIDSVLSKTP